MPVRIRLARHGRRKRPFYHIVVADSRAKRDGKFIEKIGTYNPLTHPATITLDREKAVEWILKGAQPSETVRSILRLKGVLYRIHLLKGVKKGALTQEEADRLYQEFIQKKEEKLRQMRREELMRQRQFWEKVSGAAESPSAEPQEVSDTEESTTESATGENVTTEAQDTSEAEAANEQTATDESTEDVDTTAAESPQDEPTTEEETNSSTESDEEKSET